jgi:hypothetical protein
MEVITQIDQRLASCIPLYSDASAFAQTQYQKTLSSLNNVYTTSEARVNSVRKATKGFKRQALQLCSQSADDLLDYLEDKLTIDWEEMSPKDKRERVVKILNHLKHELIDAPIHRVTQFNDSIIERGRTLSAHYILPLFITFKATVLVSREMMMEALGERLGQLKMTYKVSKDGVTMFFAGEFDEEKILARVGQNLSSFRQLTVSFVQKGMEIQISKRDLFENYHTVVEKITEIVKGVSSKGIEQWNDTKSKTMNLYHTVLNRIKEKEIQIKTEYVTEPAKTKEQEVAPEPPAKDEAVELKEMTREAEH